MGSDFHKRFGIEVSQDEGRKRFLRRAHNEVFDRIRSKDSSSLLRTVTNRLGQSFGPNTTMSGLVRDDFHVCLQALEEIVRARPNMSYSDEVERLLGMSEVDIGIRWKDGKFFPAGADELDDVLVSDSLRWLKDRGYPGVAEPYERGLTKLLEGNYKDSVRDVYEALESLAMIVLDNDRELSRNREKLVKACGVSDAYKRILQEVIDYGCQFRHGEGSGNKRPTLTEQEAESFVYMAGVFIRLCITTIKRGEDE